MTELSFLIDLLLNEKLSIKVKAKVADRIRDIEQKQPVTTFAAPFNRQAQAPSTQRILDEIAAHPPEPIVATTAIAAQALASRAQVMSQAVTGKQEPGRTSPRKF